MSKVLVEGNRICAYATPTHGPQSCSDEWWVSPGYFLKGKDRNLYACELHARWRMKFGGVKFIPLKKQKAAVLVSKIQRKFEIPRYYEGSSSLELSTGGATLRIEPTEYGTAKLSISLGVGAVDDSALEPIITAIKNLKVANDMRKEASKKEVAK